ncbi:SET domain-containing protein [Westerdykella ornata]|uniref:SET domain-containing protein n=1 Tax=Westerdykella ornata TaxID=318751 RepID=A0A6A6JEE9_WESOR|nr:SET domain-containing protein [Westerdykella ornata]KAF2274543.1 SET domain-containing protein [Westerdykella ornata]
MFKSAGLLVFALISLVTPGLSEKSTSHVAVLYSQCWHEFPLSTAILRTSRDGSSELVSKVSFIANPSQNQPPLDRLDNYAPWTHEPICTGVLQSLDSKLCVYTNATFSNGRGISIITTPRIADEFANLPIFRSANALDGINVFSGAWYTEKLPGKGVGMLARKQLKFKDRVTAYTPALVALLEDELKTMEREQLYRVAVNQLPEATRDAYMDLAYVYGEPKVRVQDIVKANTFQLHVGGQNHLAVFPETSRLNHACAPNAQYYLDPALLTHFVHATRPISIGEEITISYTSPLELTDSRQRHLQEGFHFTCSCPRCSAKATTDATLHKIGDLQTALNDWSATSTATPKLAEKLIQLYRTEGLDGFLDVPYGFAALAYNAVGDTTRAIKYAKLAKEAILLKDGPWTPNMQIWTELLKDPTQHWSFRRRK